MIVLGEDVLQIYELITKDINVPMHDYTSPEDEGAAIEKCSILQETNVEYSNVTTIQFYSV